MTSVPERAAAVFSATRSSTRPLPVPFVPLEIVTHAVLEVALHAHPGWVVTSTCSVLPENRTSLNSFGATWNVQGTGGGGGVGGGGDGGGGGVGGVRRGEGAGRG